MSIGVRMVGVFLKPKRTFAALQAQTQHKDWWVPMLVLFAISLVGGCLLYPDALEKSIYNQLQHYEKLTEKDWPDYLKNARETGLWSASTMPIGKVIGIFICAGLYWGIVVLILRGGITYKKTLAVVNYSFLVEVFQAVVSVPLAMAKEVTRVQIRLELLIPESLEGIAFFDHLALISVFEMWKYSVLGLGLIIVGNVHSRVAKYCLFALCLLGAWSSSVQEWGPSMRLD
ncbi:MAG: YIP1 family protein [Candidatus Latescibacteria bacterium]|nr:YIP1 family protein [Candidatus Latescibacterota bacterium]